MCSIRENVSVMRGLAREGVGWIEMLDYGSGACNEGGQRDLRLLS